MRKPLGHLNLLCPHFIATKTPSLSATRCWSRTFYMVIVFNKEICNVGGFYFEFNLIGGHRFNNTIPLGTCHHIELGLIIKKCLQMGLLPSTNPQEERGHL